MVAIVAFVALALFRPPAYISAVGGWKKCACRYQHAETTGLMDTVARADGSPAIIQFTSDSDPTALATLNHIKKSMIFGTSDDDTMVGSNSFRQKITLRGEISDIITREYLHGDDFYWFRLRSWTLEVPFDIQVSHDYNPDVAPVVKSCFTLSEAGVEDPIINGRVVSLKSFLTTRQ